MKNKSLISLFLFSAVLSLILIFSASASTLIEGDCGNTVSYILDSNGTLTISGTGEMQNWFSYSIVPWNPYRNSIKNVIISDGVTNIGNFAFLNCTSLSEITIPSSVTSIGNSAFYYCPKLTNIEIPANLKTIGNWAFCYCDGLTDITIPASVTDIGYCALYNCNSITRIIVSANSKSYSSDTRGVLFNKDKTTLIHYPAGNVNTSYRVPSSVTSIETYSFCHAKNLKTITMPENVSRISGKAFYNTAYYNDESNRENGVLYIGNYLIEASPLLSGNYTIKAGTKVIADNAFENCPDPSCITIPDSVTTIGSYSLRNCTKIEVDVNNPNYSSDENGVLFNKNKTILIKYPSGNAAVSYTVPSSVTAIADYAFSYCNNLTTIAFEKGSRLTSVGEGAFNDCKNLSDISLPMGIESIGSYAFDSCCALDEITIPDTASYIGNYTFFSCTNLTINGYDGSVPHDYATENNLPFATLSIIYGDISGDRSVDVSDVITVLQLLAGDGFSHLAQSQKTASDVNSDEIIDISDVIRILQFLASSNASLNS